jgi:Spy/CpxP family protein refolding chaperone
MKQLRVLLASTSVFFICFTAKSFSQNVAANADKELSYTKTIHERAAKIVAPLGITDTLKASRVTKIIADQYRSLNDIHTYRNDKTKALKSSGAEKEAVDAQVKSLEDEANAKLAVLHTKYLSALSKELTPAQVDQVKDGMTYSLVKVTYNAYLDEIPRLTDEQKKQILTWLIEAREHAIDAESSEKKHGWFGKYKGRINNYLSAAGYDLKKEGEEWEKRRNAAKQGKTASN